jgi:2-keto-4-pentenoate hydratase/2-oxohepta-3-ene-1,7-dioic acid hydratase in catechol pathway
MRLVTYTNRGTTRLGAMLDEGHGVDLNRAGAATGTTLPADILAFLQAGDAALDGARRALAWAKDHVDTRREQTLASGLAFALGDPGVRLEAPVPRPGKVLALGVNYKDHSAEANIEVPKRPLIFSKVSSCITGPGAPIHLPKASPFLDYEGELCLVIGKRARHTAPADALAHVAGYMIGNDVSVRDWQFHSPTWMMGKSFDTHGPTGPWLVTRDEVPDVGALRLRTWVNGDLRQDAKTSDLIFGVEPVIEYLTKAFTLEPGDVIFTGTPAGVGSLRDPRVYMKTGDVVRIEITGLGVLENTVADEPV